MDKYVQKIECINFHTINTKNFNFKTFKQILLQTIKQDILNPTKLKNE